MGATKRPCKLTCHGEHYKNMVDTLDVAAMRREGTQGSSPAGQRSEGSGCCFVIAGLVLRESATRGGGGGGGGGSMGSKMGYEAKLVRSFSRVEPQKLGLAVVAGCLAVSLLFVAVFRPPVNASQILGLRLTMPGGSPTMVVVEEATSSTRLEGVGINNPTLDNTLACATSVCQNDKDDLVQEETSIVSVPPPQQPSIDNSQLLDDDGRDNSTRGNRLECDGAPCKEQEGNSSVIPVFPTLPENATGSSTQSGSPKKASDEAEVSCDPKSGLCEVDVDSHVHQSPPQSDSGNQNVTQEAELSCDPKSGLCKIDEDIGAQASSLLKSGDHESNTGKESPMQKRKPLCDTSNQRFDICDMAGDVRILGQSSSVLFVDDPPLPASAANESWRIRPYARKGDNTALGHVREVLVTSSLPGQAGAARPACAVRHDVPAVVFSVRGYTGNFFHDFTDVLIPLFLTSRPFNGEVQFLITNYSWWWVNKYRLIFKQLTRYDIIDFDKEDKVHCYPRAIVGLTSHKELSIDPSKPPQGFSMVEFAKFMRTTFSLERDTVTRTPGRKPRLMIISRKRTRSLVNVRKVVQMARKLGFDVVVGEMGVTSDVAAFARLVNSCDVLMGVHGAGLTNLIFLPTNGTLIQIVPWGGLEWISKFDFGEPAVDTHLRYLQYSIKEEESTLIQQYPRDHPVFKDPLSFHKQGWHALGAVFLDKQNVTLDVKRFRSVLLQVLDHLPQ